MPSRPHDAARLIELGRNWIAAWNCHDLERVLALYAEDSEMTSDKIPFLGFDPSGALHGKPRIREYWSLALQRLPNLHFDLIDVYVSPDSLVVFYQNERPQDLRIPARRCRGPDQAGFGEPFDALTRRRAPHA